MDGGGRKGGMIGLLLLHAYDQYRRLERKPPVTAALIAANTLIYMRPGFLHPILHTLDRVLFNPYLILKNKDMKRFILSPFYHFGEPHLFYNMLSLLWKGVKLESAMGSMKFASMVACLVGLSQGITLLLAKTLLLVDYDKTYYNEYSVGFSGVLFAMKVVLYSEDSDNYTYVHGFMVPARYAAWAELVLIQMFVPGVSFLGHLGGVLAGLLYLYFRSSYTGPNLLLKILRGFSSMIGWPVRYARRVMFGSTHNRISGGGTLRRSGALNSAGVWRCQACTFDNSDWLSNCEMCESQRSISIASGSGIFDARTMSVSELRRRRIQRFAR